MSERNADFDPASWRNALIECWDWPSPEAGFVAYVASTISEPLPLGARVLAYADRRRIHEAPVLAAVGYALVEVIDDDTQSTWAQGFARLARREPFPSDRSSFAYEPLELLGICLGAMRCRGVDAGQIEWLRGVIDRVGTETENMPLWPRVLGALAAHIVSRPWAHLFVPALDQLALDELGLLLWLCVAQPALAAAHGLDRAGLVATIQAQFNVAASPPREAPSLAVEWAAQHIAAAAAPRAPAAPALRATVGEPRWVWLAVATEWASGRGGLSTFNRELCRAAAQMGHRVLCLVPALRPGEADDAARAGVELVVAPAAIGMSEEARLALLPQLPPGCTPDLVVGHGRVTGPAAQVLAATHFQGARRLHFLHMAPGAIDWFKDNAPDVDVAASTEARERLEADLAATAHIALAVGPLLCREFARLLHPRNVRVHEFLPGLGDRAEPLVPPPGAQCLVLGRAEDLELKGLDVAARAVARAGANRPELRPMLMVRGAPPGTGDQLRVELQRRANDRGLDVRVRNFTADAMRIADDLRQSVVVLMPSRSEGFGLVGLEAISAGVPVLVSSRSGLGELLERETPDFARSIVTPITGDLRRDTAAWAQQIEQVLQNPAAAFERAVRLRRELEEVLVWAHSVDALIELVRGTAPL